jgi:sulfur carrier protein
MKLKKINLQMNGEPFYLESFTYFTISDLLQYFNFNKSLIVLEYNGKICIPLLWSKTIIKNNDKFDVITIVGGG